MAVAPDRVQDRLEARRVSALRSKPYTARGIKRLKCFRCGDKGFAQWNICADGPYRVLCRPCDNALNALVLKWAGFADWRAKMKKYRARP